MPVPSSDSPPGHWPLSGQGLASARALRKRLPAGARLVSSTERKAWETLADKADVVVRDDRFDEVSRAGEPWGGDFRRLRQLYVSGVPHSGWEDPADAADRFQAGVEAALSGTCGGVDVVVATHGMVLTTWLVSRGLVARSEAAAFWSDLAFPDCLRVDPDGRCWSRHP